MSPRDLDGTLVPLWEEHHKHQPVLTILCGADGRRCRNRLAKVWATPAGLLLHYHQHVAPKRFGVDAGDLTDEQLAAYVAGGDSGLRRYEPGRDTGIGTGLADEDGWLALLDVDDYWHPPQIGCLSHSGLVEVDRARLLQPALKAVRTGRHAEMRLRL